MTGTFVVNAANSGIVTAGGHMPGDVSGGRHFADIDRLRQMPIPKEMDLLADVLNRESQLLALANTADEPAIHNAYGADLQLLIRYRDAFKRTIEAAVSARADLTHIDAQAFLGDMVAKLGDIAHEPALDLSEEAIKLEPAERLARLQQEFRSDVEDLRSGVALWLRSLAENDVVSVVEWLGRHGIKYHFYHMTSSRQELDRTKHDPGINLVGRHVTTTATTAVDVYSERRTHTVVNAQVYELDQYPDRVPGRIARLIDTIAPEVRPFVNIVGGEVTKEEVTRRQESGQILTETHKVWVRDPAPVLFNSWAVAGWGGSLQEPARSTYRGHVLQRANYWLLASAVISAFFIAFATFGAGRRGALLAAIVCAIIVAGSQFSLRYESGSRSQCEP